MCTMAFGCRNNNALINKIANYNYLLMQFIFVSVCHFDEINYYYVELDSPKMKRKMNYFSFRESSLK